MGRDRESRRIGGNEVCAPLFQQAIDFDFTASGEIDASVDDDRNHKTRGEGGAIALTV
jgi:hypothetical protein